MAGPSAVADASASLVAYLEDALAGVVTPHAVVLGASEAPRSKDDVVVAVDLVAVAENAHLQNGQWAPDASVDPRALALDLRYRVTVRSVRDDDHDPTASTYRRHEVLGHVLQSLDAGVVDDPHLAGVLAAGPPLRVTYDPDEATPDHHDLAPVAPALHYRVSPVVVDPIPDANPPRPRLPIRQDVPRVRLPASLHPSPDS